MPANVHDPVLTSSQAACLIALRDHQGTKTDIALQARLDLRKTAIALERLEVLGLARRGEGHAWRATARGRIYHFKTVPDRPRRNSGMPGRAGRRLLALLDRPMRGGEIAERLGVTKQRVHQLVVKLYAQGRVRLGDREGILRIVSRSDDETSLLSRDEERVLSSIPVEYATTAGKIALAVRLSEKQVRQILKHFAASGFIETLEGLTGDTVYQITASGLEHPQHRRSARQAQAPRLPVESDRVRAVLSAILDTGSLRIRNVGDMLKIPPDSIRALMQYLKRKALVQKTGKEFAAPYALTDKGREALAEMTRRQAA